MTDNGTGWKHRSWLHNASVCMSTVAYGIADGPRHWLRVQIMAGARLHPRRDAAMSDSVRAFEVLPEIMQQAARVNDPHAAARREFIRCTR